MFSFFSHLISGTGDNTVLLVLAIMLCAFIFEDAATIIVGVLAADGDISICVALLSLYAGTISADIVLYSLGALARSHPTLARYVDHDFAAPLKSWLEERYRTVIFSGHFMPGLRFTSYVASGFFRFPLQKYLPFAFMSGLLLNTTLFTLSYLFGSVSSTWVKEARWSVAALFILVIFFVARHNVQLYKKRRSEMTLPKTEV